MRAVDTLVFINNSISARLARAALAREGIEATQVALFLLRRVPVEWCRDCAIVVDYRHMPSLSPIGQARFIGFYRRAAVCLRGILAAGTIRRVYLVNSDNLLSNHVLNWAAGRADVKVTVLAEGLMNFQDIRLRNRASWRSSSKRFIAPMLGLRWREPRTHLSGAYEPVVREVITFSADGLFAPIDKVEIIPFEPIRPIRRAEAATVLIAHTGLWQWMSRDAYSVLARAFVEWLSAQRYSRILFKPHPRIPTGPLMELLPKCEILETSRSLEDLAPDLEAATVVGMCCTGLVTLKLLRPDLRCIDFGSDYYCQNAYFGDHSVTKLLRAAGVELVPWRWTRERAATKAAHGQQVLALRAT